MMNSYNYQIPFQSQTPQTPNGKMGLAAISSKDIAEQVDFAQKILIAQIQNIVPGEDIKISESIRTIMDTFQVGQRARGLELQEQQLNLSRGLLSSSLGNLVGNEVDSHEPTFFFDGSQDQKIGYDAPVDTINAKVLIQDQNGMVIRSENLDLSKKEFIWDGKLQNASPASPGLFTIIIQAESSQGNITSISPRVRTLVTGVEFNEEGIPTLMSGELPISRIKGTYSKSEKINPLQNLIV